jgi:cell division protein FtsW
MTTVTRNPRSAFVDTKGIRRTPQVQRRTGIRSLRRPRLVGQSTTNFWLLLTVVVVLNLVGLVMVLSASSVMSLRETGSSWTYFLRQAMWMAVGFGVLGAFLVIDLSVLRRYAKPLLLASLGMLLAVLVPGLGVSANGSTRWLGFGPLQLQPAELVKFALIVWVADLLARRSKKLTDARLTVVPPMLALGAVAMLLMMQPNLGTTIVVGCIVLVVVYVAGAPARPLAGCAVVGTFAAVVMALAVPYRRARVLAFLNPWADPGNTGYQVIQSQVGLANGHLLGTGLGASRAKWGFLPFAHTDFIFAIIGEELGLVGAVAVVALFVALAVLGVRTAMRASDRFGTLLATGITTWLAVQAVVNIGAVVGAMPITGVPLPFISFGGSSLLFTLAATGVLLNISRNPGAAAGRR